MCPTTSSTKASALSRKQSDTSAYVIQGSVSIETAVAERPTAAISVRVPPGVTLAPQDFDELTIDYPALPYRAWSERHANLVAYWRLDEAAVSLAVDSKGNTPLTYGGGNNLQYRAYRQETSAVPYGGAPKWEHTFGNGLHAAVLPVGIGDDVTIAGFIRQDAGKQRPSVRLAGEHDRPVASCVGRWFAPGQARRPDAQRTGRDHR